ncbi:MAG: TetR/AcrR family transcriptional regulator [Deltaproteobacteria bacterium]|nr:MAG: TetR/AcrR family transcriptional regulator [Deltaproteobacteria bacterium]
MPLNSRKQREAELARTSFVEAGVQVFSKKGFHGATMDEIARLAGYSPGAIYRYFHSKDEVLMAVIERIGERFLEQVREEPPVRLDFVDRLRWFAIRHTQLADDHRDFFATFVVNNPAVEWDRTTTLGAKACQFFDDLVTGIAGLMALGIEEGVLRPGDPKRYARLFTSLMKGMAEGWPADQRTTPVAEWVEQIIDIFFHGVATPKEH